MKSHDKAAFRQFSDISKHNPNMHRFLMWEILFQYIHSHEVGTHNTTVKKLSKSIF